MRHRFVLRNTRHTIRVTRAAAGLKGSTADHETTVVIVVAVVIVVTAFSLPPTLLLFAFLFAFLSAFFFGTSDVQLREGGAVV